MATKRKTVLASADDTTASYKHAQEAVQRPDVGVQDHFSARKPPKTYRYDSSLDPALSWDENRDRDLAEWLIGLVQRCATEGEAAVFGQPQVWAGGGVQVQSLKSTADLLQALSKPFLNWTGKAERHQINVPTVPLFVHERHSTKAILDGIKHRKAKGSNLDLFGDGGLDVTDKLDAYEHKGPWQNRMVLGDSLQIMNSMLQFEGLGGQVQMVYMDPPYGVKFGSNFQPFVRKNSVKPAADEDMTREPEMVKAYRDTWELGLHSYLTYLRDRLLVARELLHESGSVFVQISDENLHHVRELLDEVFGRNNFKAIISFVTNSGLAQAEGLATVGDYLLWYSKDHRQHKFRKLFTDRPLSDAAPASYSMVQFPDGTRRALTKEERQGGVVPDGARRYRYMDLSKPGPGSRYEIEFEGRRFSPGNRWWGTTPDGIAALAQQKRLASTGNTLWYLKFFDDFAYSPVTNLWSDTASSFTADKLYVVQTNVRVVERCMLMTSDPGDLVLDPTCGSGTTAYVSELWGRRWITCDTSRVPLGKVCKSPARMCLAGAEAAARI